MEVAMGTLQTMRLCRNFNDAFQAIVEIAKRLKIDLNREVSSVINGLLTFGGMIVGGVTGGPRGAVSGGLAGASLANTVMRNNNFISLADYLLKQLPAQLQTKLVNFFQTLLYPFMNIEDAVRKITSTPLLAGQFRNMMETFLNQNDSGYHVS